METCLTLNEQHYNFNLTSKSKPLKYKINEKGCFVCISHCKNDFGYIQIGRNGKRYFAHRYVYTIFHGEIPDGMVVRHKCDNPTCINPDHLEIGTTLDNIRDRDERNRTARQKGTSNPMNKIDDETVLKILFDTNGTQYEIAERYGVSQIHVSQIKRGSRWRHLTEKYNCYLEDKPPKRVLSKDDIINIYNNKIDSTRELAKLYEISESAISNIRNSKRHTKITSNL